MITENINKSTDLEDVCIEFPVDFLCFDTILCRQIMTGRIIKRNTSYRKKECRRTGARKLASVCIFR